MIILLFTLGLVIGSFLNVCIHRLVQGQSAIFPPSYCPSCGQALRAMDLIPVISFLLLQGKCRYCDTKISIRYVFVELLTGFLFVVCFQLFEWTYTLLQGLTFTCFLIIITFIDIDHQLILDRVLLWMAGSGALIQAFLLPWHVLIDSVAAGLVGGLLMLVIAILSRGGMGGGDVKFVAVLGLWLGTKLLVLALFLSFLSAGGVGVLLLLLRIKGRKDPIPFGPFLAFGGLLSMLYGPQIITWYWGLAK